MPPDLNSLPTSRSPSGPNSPLQSRMSTMQSVREHSPSPTSPPPTAHTPPHSLAAAAALNTAFNNERRRSPSNSRHPSNARRRSSLMLNLNLNDPTIPGPGELQHSSPHNNGSSGSLRTRSPITTADPNHHRAPSLGALHQELENEQEAQVNRLLHLIRLQQEQLQAVQAQNTTPLASAAIDDSTPTSERSMSFPQIQPGAATIANAATFLPRSPAPLQRPSFDLSRQSSRHSLHGSRQGSPSIRPMSGSISHQDSNDWGLGSSAGRDESAFFQAETQMLTRENQMLKLRIRELERQVQQLSGSEPHSPAIVSNLAGPPLAGATTEGASGAASASTVESKDS